MPLSVKRLCTSTLTLSTVVGADSVVRAERNLEREPFKEIRRHQEGAHREGLPFVDGGPQIDGVILDRVLEIGLRYDVTQHFGKRHVGQRDADFAMDGVLRG